MPGFSALFWISNVITLIGLLVRIWMDGLKLARAHLYLIIQCAPRCEVGEKRGHDLEKDDVLSFFFKLRKNSKIEGC